METVEALQTLNINESLITTQNTDVPEIHISVLPIETLQYIFKQLPTVHLIKCRAVSMRWKETIDSITKMADYWREACKKDHRNVYTQASSQSKQDLSSQDLYKSLYSWRNLEYAEESSSIAIDVPSTLGFWSQIGLVNVWNGTVAIQYGTVTRFDGNSIEYFDGFTFERVKTLDIGSMSWSFTENEYMIAYLCPRDPEEESNELRIVPKSDQKLLFDKMIKIGDVEKFILFDNRISYMKGVPGENVSKIYIFNLSDDKILFLRDFDGYITYGYYLDNLYIMMNTENSYDIYKYTGMDFVLEDTIPYRENPVTKFCSYGLIENMMTEGYHIFPPDIEFLRHVNVQQYGDLIFISSTNGILRVYDRESFCADQRTKPLRKYNLKEIFDLVEY